MKVAITVRRISPLHGMSVRDTAQAIVAAEFDSAGGAQSLRVQPVPDELDETLQGDKDKQGNCAIHLKHAIPPIGSATAATKIRGNTVPLTPDKRAIDTISTQSMGAPKTLSRLAQDRNFVP